MKLVIQIPAHNEEASIGAVLEGLPKKIEGIDEIINVVLDDGSNDETKKIASEHNAKIISFKKRQGLSSIFKLGVEYALFCQADILVNIDGDNQYKASDIEKLIKPILQNEADITIGARPIDKIKNFSFFKKNLQKFGSFMVKLISREDVKDAPSGFRAFNTNALLHLNIFNPFSYTIESIIQAHNKNLIIKNIDIEINEQENRKSKLFKNNFDYIFEQTKNLIRFFIIYRPARFFILFGTLLFLIGFSIGIRFLFYQNGHIQSLILCAIVLTLSFICYTLAILGDLLSINRKLLEEIRYELRYKKYKK
ncbi:MAG: glycosyltransferase family 2 protein [Candidatus Gastranaerophilales bacterium]|nr:glycosyltransferase family 2 protein [Candidatus Gastranaerophilales bacterium]